MHIYIRICLQICRAGRVCEAISTLSTPLRIAAERMCEASHIKKLLPCKRIRAYCNYLSTTYYIILTYVFLLTVECRQHLFGISNAVQRCNSEVIFKYILLISGSHHPRLAVTLKYILLSSSSFFHIPPLL